MKNINKNYSDYFEKNLSLINTEEVNCELENYILSKINYNNDLFTQARELYIILANTLCYDSSFIFYAKNSDKSNDIYNININNVTLNKNEVICTPWAKIYVALLNKLGIKSIIEGDYHKYVVLKINDEFIKADVTNMDRYEEGHFVVNDFVNVRLNLPTICFLPYLEIDDFQERLKISDEKIGYDSTLFFNTLNDFIKKRNEIKTFTFENIIEILKSIDNVNLTGLERCIYTNRICRMFLDNEKLNIDYLLCENENNALVIIIYYYEFDQMKIIHCKNSEIKRLSFDEHIEQICQKNTILYSSRKKIDNEHGDYARKRNIKNKN